MATIYTEKGHSSVNDQNQSFGKKSDNLISALDTSDDKEIFEILKRYDKQNKVVMKHYPKMERKERLDWTISYALFPDWYGSNLVSRMQNTMLVSALLLTVSAALFVTPPFDNTEKNSITHRVFSYITGVCSFFFLLSIYLGVAFIENAMSRAYSPTDRFILIMKYYTIRDLSETFMVAGSFLFPAMLMVPMWDNYHHFDSYFLFGVGGLYALILSTTPFILAKDAYAMQKFRREEFEKVILYSEDEDVVRYLNAELKKEYLDKLTR